MLDRIPLLVEAMTLADLDRVLEIERLSFSAPWSAQAYRYEITQNEHSTMLVVRPAPRWHLSAARRLRFLLSSRREPALGHAGFWLLEDEAHIATIAVHPEWRGRGLGELLLVSLLREAIQIGAQRATLEVRVSNTVAQGLYHKHGFQIVSRCRHYYADNNEDAYIMATPPFNTPGLGDSLMKRQAELHARLRDEPRPAAHIRH